MRAQLAVVALSFCVGCGREPGPALTRTPPPPPDAALVCERVVGSNQDVYLIPVGGGPDQRLTDDAAQDGLPRFTPDGTTVVFSSNRTGNWQLWEVAAQGGEARRVRANGAREWQAAPSPDGKRLAMLSNLGGPESLWIVDRDSGASRLLVRHGSGTVLGNPDWSADARRIVFSSNWRIGHQIYVADVATGAAERLSGLWSGGCEPRFSPDGRKVVYVSRGHHRPASRLVEHDLATRRERVLVGWPALNYDPVYSPDASELAFASNITGEFQIYRQRLSDGEAWRVTFGPGSARYPDYRPRRSAAPDLTSSAETRD